MKGRLSFADVSAAASRVPDLKGIILVGGQALNFWAEHFGIVTSETEAMYGVALSDDIDFLGSASAASSFAPAVGGTVQIAGEADPHTPNTAVVTLKIDGNDQVIDFMGSLKGFSSEELDRVVRWAVPVYVGRDADTRLLVMHSVHCLTSQLENVYGRALDRRSRPDGPRHAQRVRLAVEACRRTIEDVLQQGRTRDALDIAKSMHALSLLETAMRAQNEDGIDVGGAIPVNGMPEAFTTQRAPQLQREREIATRKYQRLLERRAAIAKKRER